MKKIMLSMLCLLVSASLSASSISFNGICGDGVNVSIPIILTADNTQYPVGTFNMNYNQVPALPPSLAANCTWNSVSQNFTGTVTALNVTSDDAGNLRAVGYAVVFPVAAIGVQGTTIQRV